MHYHIKKMLMESIQAVVDNIGAYTREKGELTRNRKLPAFALILFLITLRVKASAMELAEFFEFYKPSMTWMPRQSALCQQRAKLLPSAMRDVFRNFTTRLLKREAPNREGRRKKRNHWQFFAADGTRVTFQSWAGPGSKPWRTRNGAGKRICAGHLTAIWDVVKRVYLDAFLQPIHQLDEREAFLQMIDRFQPPEGVKPVLLADRGFPSWNVLARLREKGFHYLIRCKDTETKGSQAWSLKLPKTDVFDVWVTLEITRKPNRQAALSSPHNRILLGKNDRFDFLGAGSRRTYKMTVRVVRIRLENGEYETLLTNLPRMDFSADALKKAYALRWSVEESFSALKCHIGLEDFHCKKPEYVEQEIWGRLTAFNYVSALQALACPLIKVGDEVMYEYKPDFSFAVNRGLRFLIRSGDHKDEALLELLARERHPIRPNRTEPRGKSREEGAHSLNHRAACSYRNYIRDFPWQGLFCVPKFEIYILYFALTTLR